MYIKGRERGVYLVLVDKIDFFQPSGGNYWLPLITNVPPPFSGLLES